MKRCCFAGLFVAILLVSTAAFADPIIIGDDLRRTTVIWNAPTDQTSEAAGPNDALSSSMVVATSDTTATLNATLTSSFADPMHWVGVGASDMTWTATGSNSFLSSALFDLEFQVTAPVNYSFTGSFFHSNASVLAAFSDAGGRAELTGRAPIFFEQFFAFETDPGPGAADRVFTGTLAPGHYELMVQARTSGGFGGSATAASGFRFTMDLTAADAAPVPEPASLLLVGMGLAGLAARRRSREQAPSRSRGIAE